MEKRTRAEQQINCSACGYRTCEEMAIAIHNECNHKDNCIQYIKGEVEKESAVTKQMAQEMEGKNAEIQSKNELIAELVAEVAVDFDSLDTSITEMSIGNNSNAEESTGISVSMSDVVGFCDSLKDALEKIQGLLVKLEENNAEITDVAEETNLLSLNASIEAARAGEAGRGFAIIAENIKKLADHSKDTASDSDQNKEQIQTAIEELLTDAGKLIEIIDSVNLRVTNLAASTQEIAASADLVSSISADLKEKLDRLND
jgi:methyl-accepting chemotaxis protein